MTPADLPPLPETNTVPRDYYTREQIQSYAKLAVREALERAAVKIQADLTEAEQTWQPHRTIADQAFIDAKSQSVQDIRAIAEDYK